MERFDYSYHSSREKAEAAIEDYFAIGEVDSTDDPRVERRSFPDNRVRYAVVLIGLRG